MGFVVTAPYLTARVKDDFGSDVVREFYTGGVLPKDTHPDDVEKLVRKGMVAEQGSDDADAAVPVGQPVQFDQAGMPVAPKPGPPAKASAAKPGARPAAGNKD